MNVDVVRSRFGTLSHGAPVELFTLTNASGMLVRITNFGTIITELHVPDRHGTPGDVVLGLESLDAYLQGHPYLGCTVGRVANRIADASLTLDGHHHQLTRNDGRHHLHGGVVGFDRALWLAAPLEDGRVGVRFTHVSPDGDQGYPGRLEAQVVMSLGDDNTLTVDYTATTDRPTPVSLTNHSYFNLATAGEVMDHELMINADGYTPTDRELIPTGAVVAVRGTPFDFSEARPIGSRIDEVGGVLPGYDHNYVLKEPSGVPGWSARLRDPRSGRVLTIATTEPGLQCYTGNALDGSLAGKHGARYLRHTAVCLEPQRFPDALHHAAFPANVLRPGDEYRQVTHYRFTVD